VGRMQQFIVSRKQHRSMLASPPMKTKKEKQQLNLKKHKVQAQKDIYAS